MTVCRLCVVRYTELVTCRVFCRPARLSGQTERRGRLRRRLRLIRPYTRVRSITRSAYLYNVCLAWYNVVLTARSLQREIQTTGAKC